MRIYTEEQKVIHREKNKLRMREWYKSLTIEQKRIRMQRSRWWYKKLNPEQRESKRVANLKWYRSHPEVVHRKNRRPGNRLAAARYHARINGHEWKISLSNFLELISKRCHYCDGKIAEVGSGLDRMDNSKGYIYGNVVPCCRNCNLIKNNLLTYDEMVVAMNAIKGFRLKKALGETSGTLICES